MKDKPRPWVVVTSRKPNHIDFMVHETFDSAQRDYRNKRSLASGSGQDDYVRMYDSIFSRVVYIGLDKMGRYMFAPIDDDFSPKRIITREKKHLLFSDNEFLENYFSIIRRRPVILNCMTNSIRSEDDDYVVFYDFEAYSDELRS